MPTPQDDAKDNAIIRILQETDRNLDEATAEIMRRDEWLIRHAVRRGLEAVNAGPEAVREASNEATNQQIISEVLSDRR